MDHSSAAELESAALTEAAAVHLPRPSFVVDTELDAEICQHAKSNHEPWLADDYFHPHTFGSWCRRREVYRLLHRRLKIQQANPKPQTAAKLIFEAGHAAHNRFRDYLLPKKMVGYWMCQNCGRRYGHRTSSDGSIIHEKFMYRPDACTRCGLAAGARDDMTLHYVEIPLRDESLMIDGTTDGLIFHRQRLRVVELKSEDSTMHVDRAGLTLGHGMQGACYAHCFNKNYAAEIRQLNNGFLLNTAAIIYLNKNSYRAKCYIAGTVPLIKWIEKEIGIVNQIVEELAPKITSAADIEKLELDAHFNKADRCERVCRDRDITMAKRCASREACFASTFVRKRKKENA